MRIKSLWKISIRYILAEIHTEIRAEDPLDALKEGLELGLKRHGFSDRGTFNYVFNLLMEEQPERNWFSVARVQ